MFKGISIADTTDYVSKRDPDKSSPTVWKLGILDSILKSKLQDIITKSTRREFLLC